MPQLNELHDAFRRNGIAIHAITAQPGGVYTCGCACSRMPAHAYRGGDDPGEAKRLWYGFLIVSAHPCTRAHTPVHAGLPELKFPIYSDPTWSLMSLQPSEVCACRDTLGMRIGMRIGGRVDACVVHPSGMWTCICVQRST